jgi:predicted RNA-binding Zn ribbon-like protein
MTVTKGKVYPQLTEDKDVERAAAPGELSLVHDFVRTGWWLDDPDHLLEWLRNQDLVAAGERVRHEDLQPLIELRGALRSMLMAQHEGVPADAEVVRVLNSLGAEAVLQFAVDADGLPSLEPGASGPVGRVIGTVLRIVYDAMSDGTWRRMKICRASDCQWAFYDSSRNRSGAWCSMSDCGNRAKARAFRQRHHL